MLISMNTYVNKGNKKEVAHAPMHRPLLPTWTGLAPSMVLTRIKTATCTKHSYPFRLLMRYSPNKP
jgi:hypothetical protein